MAHFHDPCSYANTLYGNSPFGRRRPSPPPTTYFPREAYDPYLRALADEQAARTALQDAVQREREARQRRAEEEVKARIRERMKRDQARQRLHQSMYGFPSTVPGYSEYGYPTYAYGNEDMDYEDEYPQYSPFFSGPRREPMRKQKSPPMPRTARSKSPVYKRQPTPPSSDDSPRISIPISSPKPRRPEPSEEEKNAAAIKIQSTYRVHAALSSIQSARDRFTSLINAFSFPDTLDFESSSSTELAPLQSEDESPRPKLAYTSRNAPVHGHEDALVRLLQTLDAVESHGDRQVRERRRELVREIEKELARVDTEIRRRYEEMRQSSNEVASTSVAAEAMDVESESQTEVATSASTAPSTAPAPVSDEAPASSTHLPEPIPMDVESGTKAQPEPRRPSEHAEVPAIEEPIIEEDLPAATTTESESEVETPPNVSSQLPQAEILVSEPEQVGTKHPSFEVLSEVNMKEPETTGDSEEPVIITEVQPTLSPLSSPVETEKDFVML